jgi:general secretion pathway protein G
VLVYFCLIPSPLRVSPQTTGFTEPLLPNGDVDYFGAYERMYIDKLSPPEDNGQRLLIAALGPKTLEQYYLANNVPWEQMPTHELSKQWFETRWFPLCEHMFIDPYIKPRFLDSLDYYSFLQKEWEPMQEKRETNERRDIIEEYRQQLSTAPWVAEEHPVMARWLEERSPVLDLFGVAVRKPNFTCYRQRPEGGILYSILLPDVQANRNFGRELPIRVAERLGSGDVDGAWYDAMSMFYLSRKHYIHDPFFVTNLVGIAVEGMGRESAKVVLQHGNLTSEQLERFAQDLDSLPRKSALALELELSFAYSGLPILQNDMDTFVALVGGNREPFTNLETFFLWLFGGATDGQRFLPRCITLLPFDRNIAGKRITEFFQTAQQESSTAWNVNSTITKKYLENLDDLIQKKSQQLKSAGKWWRVPLIRTRSELIADSVISLLLPAMQAAQHAIDKTNTHLELLRLAVALERYKADNEKYPQTLDELVPKYLIEVPLEPFTGRQSFVYKPAPDADTAFLIHSAKWDETGKDGNKKDLFLRMGNVIQ